MPAKRSHRTSENRRTDEYVGSRLRMRRALVGMNQSQLGRGVGLTFQQVQKYESGANRISASKLHQFANILGVPIPFFFEGLESRQGGRRPVAQEKDDPFHKRETLEFVRAYFRIRDPAARKMLTDLIFAISRKS